MSILVDCSNCQARLQLPTGADSIRCALCNAITAVDDPRAVVVPSSPRVFHHLFRRGHVHAPPSPNGHALTGPPSPAWRGRKRAVICGVSYKDTRRELKGCINDVKCMKFLLVHRFMFPESSVLVLTEEESDPARWPTKRNIRTALRWLVEGCRSGDSLVFHFSGHGSQLKDADGDEVDGFDETLCPVDFETQGMIVDDEINATIVKPLPAGVKLHAIIDACHSGTVLDLPFLCRMDKHGKYSWEDHRPRSGVWKGTSGGEVISFSGCDDNQISSDTSSLSNGASTGAMTYAFIQAIERGHATTYGDMLTAMRSTVKNVDCGIGSGLVTSLITMLSPGSHKLKQQEPQLTANVQFDVYTKPFSL